MKKNIFYITAVLTSFMILFPVVQASAGFSIPDDAYGMSELENALENAREDGWALAFVLSDQNTTCGLATRASLAAFQELGEDCIIVYIHSPDTRWEDLPEIVHKGLTSKESGRYIPKTVITNAEMNRIIDIVPYDRGQAYIDRLKQAVERIAVKPTFLEEMKYKLMGLIE